MSARVVGLALLWVAVAGATPLPLTPPPPDVARLVPFVSAPLDKPKIEIPEIALPAPPVGVPQLAASAVVLPAAERPTAFLTTPGRFPCLVKFVSAAQSLECGKDKFLKGDYAGAVSVLDSTVRGAGDADLATQARYWLGEAYVRDNRVEQADWVFRQAMGKAPTSEYQVWAAHASGWTALRLGDLARARDTLKRLVTTGTPASIDGWARHGLALALYGLGNYADARQTWGDLVKRGAPPTLARDVAFWYGESLGRVGDYAGAETELRRFTDGGPHPLLDSGRLRLGWWTLTAGRFAESAQAFRAYLATPRRPGPDLDWGQAGLALALASSGDPDAAHALAKELTARRSTLALPVSLQLMQSAVAAKKAEEADAIVQDLLAERITPAVRAWLLLAKGDAERLAGNRDEARTQYDLAQKSAPGSDLGVHAAFRLARTDFEMREFAEAVTETTSLLAAQIPADIRASTLLLQGEAAYNAGNYSVAANAFRRVLVEFPQRPDAPLIRLSLAWVALREGRRDEARELFREFTRLLPDHPNAADALELAAELALARGDLDAGRQELAHVVERYPDHPRADFARLNRAIVMARSGDPAGAQTALRDWIARAPFPPLLPRARVALGAAELAARQPAEAAKEFTAAQRESGDALATLGLGAVALAEGHVDEAERALTTARDNGTPDVAAAAEYGLAVVAYQRGAVRDFKSVASSALHAAPTSPAAPRLLYVLTGIAVDEKDWTGAFTAAKQLVTRFPDDEAADDALERVGAGAAAAKAWPTVYDAYSMLRQRYPASPFMERARVLLADAQLHTGRADEAKQELEKVVTASPNDSQAWGLLARARELTGDRTGALDAYVRVGREATSAQGLREALLGQARLLAADKRWEQARATLDRLLKTDDQDVVLEAAYTIGDTYRGEGDLVGAAEYYMTAAYLAPESEFGRRGLLAAGQAFAALKQPDAAATVYKKLLAQSDVPSQMADAARQGLQALGRNEGS